MVNNSVYDSYAYDDLIEHHGVKGMRWGIRKDRKTSKNTIGTKKDRKKASRNVKQLSDKELSAYINRLQKERTFKSLVKSDVSPGKKFVKDILANEGKRYASKFINKAAFSAVRLAFDDNFSSADFVASLLPFSPDPRHRGQPPKTGQNKNTVRSGLTKLETEMNEPGWKPKGKTAY